MNNIFTPGWELRCDAQFLARNNDKLKAYICSPLRANTLDEVRKNMLTAKAYMLYALDTMGIYAYALMRICLYFSVTRIPIKGNSHYRQE